MSILSVAYLLFVMITVIVYFVIPKKYQWIVLLSASMAFYLSAGLTCAGYIIVTILSQYFLV